MLEAGIEDRLLLKIDSAYQLKLSTIFNDDANVNQTDDRMMIEFSVKILWRLMLSLIFSHELPESTKQLTSPSEAAMRRLIFLS